MDVQKKIKIIELLMEYRKELQSELESIDQSINSLRTGNFVETAVTPDSPEKHVQPSLDASTGNSSWANLTCTQAVERFLEEHPSKLYRASEIASFLKEKHLQGCNNKSFGSSIATTVRRLVKQGKAERLTIAINDKSVAAFKFKKRELSFDFTKRT